MVDAIPTLCKASARLRPERPAPIMATWVGGVDGIVQGYVEIAIVTGIPRKRIESKELMFV